VIDADVGPITVAAPIVGEPGTLHQLPACLYCAISVPVKIPLPVELPVTAGAVAVINLPGLLSDMLC
jgi:hypothetical protein